MRFTAIAACLFCVVPSVSAQEHEFFHTSDQCIACHSGMVSSTGQDISIGYTWRASMMANSARDPYWQAAVRREVMDHPGAQAAIEDTCSTCHMPMARFHALNNGRMGEVFANLESWDNLATDGGIPTNTCPRTIPVVCRNIFRSSWSAGRTVPKTHPDANGSFPRPGMPWVVW